MTDTKFQLRKTYRTLRAKVPAKYRDDAAKKAAEFCKNAGFFIQSERVAAYLSVKDEFDSTPIIETIWQAKKTCCLPVVAEDGMSLHFIVYRYGDKLHLNRFGILEPVTMENMILSQDLDLVIMPLVAFDAQGVRLGTGGGFYDRTFAAEEESGNPKRPFFAGLGFAAQQVPQLPADPWDVSMDAIITEKGIIKSKSKF